MDLQADIFWLWLDRLCDMCTPFVFVLRVKTQTALAQLEETAAGYRRVTSDVNLYLRVGTQWPLPIAQRRRGRLKALTQ